MRAARSLLVARARSPDIAQFCYGVKHGSHNLYLGTSVDMIQPAGDEWLVDSKLVFDGQMTCCELKHQFGRVEQGKQ
jgi:hypothetical protein